MNQKTPSMSESSNLRKMLQEIYSQISIPYIKKRASEKSHKQSPVDELHDAISYLTEKERELQVALDIAKYLLDSNEELTSRIEKMRETQTALCEENQFLINENRFLEQRIEGRSLRCDEMSESLAKTQGKLKVVASSMRKFQEKSARTLHQLADHEDLQQAKIFFEHQSENLSSNRNLGKNLELQRINERLNDQISDLEKKCDELKTNNEANFSKYKNSMIRLKESEKMQKILVSSNEKMTKKIKQYKNINLKLNEKLRKAEEELKFVDFQQVTGTTEGLQGSTSLMAELQQLEIDEGRLSLDSEEERLSPQFLRTPERFKTCSPRYTSIITCPFLEVSHESSIKIVSSPCKRDPIEEYFILTAQAVKMNSPHMDRIGILPPSFLYQRAKEEQVPFHKWHIWIENQLNFEYIQHLYQKPKASRLSRFFTKSKH